MSRFIDIKGILEHARKMGAKELNMKVHNVQEKEDYNFKFNLYTNGICISIDNTYAGFIGYLHESYTVNSLKKAFHAQFGLFGKLKVDVSHDYPCSENGEIHKKEYKFEVNADGLAFLEVFHDELKRRCHS